MSGEDEQARAGTGESHDFQKCCCYFKLTSQMVRNGTGIHISLGSEVNHNSGSGGGPAVKAAPWLEGTGAHVPAAVLRRALPGAETPWRKHLFHLGVR